MEVNSVGLYFNIDKCLICSDTIAPQIITPPRDTSFECGTASDLIAKLTAWYNSAGGAKATDNSDTVIWKQNLTLQQSITISIIH
ncbi:MAG: hypothetical protein IPJ13_18445 [Saprospiraceae bacterium]|nr:hypothetical protein [Saprospiraceae bacterium]